MNSIHALLAEASPEMLLGYCIASIWWAATVSADLKRAKKDIDALALLIGTERSRDRKHGR